MQGERKIGRIGGKDSENKKKNKSIRGTGRSRKKLVVLKENEKMQR